MTWQRRPVAAAIAEILSAIDPVVSVFATPPETLNPPAYVCGYPRSVTYDTPTFGIDTCQFQVAACAAPFDVDTLDSLLTAAKVALREADNLGGVVQYCHPMNQTNWQRVSLGGSTNLLQGDLILEIRM